MAARAGRPQLSGMTKTNPPLSESTTEAIPDAPAPLGESAAEPAITPLGAVSHRPRTVPRHACVIPRSGDAPVCGELVESTDTPLDGDTAKEGES